MLVGSMSRSNGPMVVVVSAESDEEVYVRQSALAPPLRRLMRGLFSHDVLAVFVSTYAMKDSRNGKQV